MGKSNTRQWHQPVISDTLDVLDGWEMEKRIQKLPNPQKLAIRWCYVYRTHPNRVAKRLGLTKRGLMDAIHQGRAMLR